MDAKREPIKAGVDKVVLQTESREAVKTASLLQITPEELTKTTITMIEALGDQDLTEWEINFVASLEKRFYDDERALTVPQYETLEKIYRKKY